MKKAFILTIAALLTGMSALLAQQASIPLTVINGKQYYQYQVQPKETVYGLSRRFGISQEQLIELNPFLAAGMQTGQILTIPVVQGLSPAPVQQPGTADRPQTQAAPKAVAEEEGQEYQAGVARVYLVTRRKEKIKDIASWEKVSIEDIRRMNPGVPDVLVRGSQLILPDVDDRRTAITATSPADEVQPQAQQPQNVASYLPSLPQTDEDMLFLPDEQHVLPPVVGKDHVRAVLLLPLQLSDSTSSQPTERYIEFYEGVLLAVDTLKNLGFSTDLAVYDIGQTAFRLQQTLRNNDFSGTDYVIAAGNADQIPLLSQWAREQQVRLVLPFSSRIQETAGNPYLYQVNPPQQLTQERLLSGDAAFFQDKNIVFVRTWQEEKDERYTLYQGLKGYLAARGLPVREIYEREGMASFPDSLNAHLSSQRENLIIPVPTSMSATNRLISTIAAAYNPRLSGRTSILGYPDWIALSKNNLPLLYSLNAVIYGNFYADFSREEVRRFQLRFALTFGKDILNTFPRYAMMGYDITTQLADLFCGQQYGIRPLQHSLDFVQPDPAGGWYNRNVYIIRYSSDRKITASLLP